MAAHLELAVIGTGTAVGKTWTMGVLVRGLRALGRRVWVHKPMACGGWDGATAEDGRALAKLCADAQPLSLVCPRQYELAAAPCLAAEAVGAPAEVEALKVSLAACRGEHDLLIEGAGGLLSPLTADRQGIAAVLAPATPTVVVATEALGTLNATALTVEEARRRGLGVLGLVLNGLDADDSLAARTAARELEVLTGERVLARLEPGPALLSQCTALAEAVLARRSRTASLWAGH